MPAGYTAEMPQGTDDPTIMGGNHTRLTLDVSSLPTHEIPHPGRAGLGAADGEVWSGVLWSYVTDVEGYPAGTNASYEQFASSYLAGAHGDFGSGGWLPPDDVSSCYGFLCFDLCIGCMDWVINPAIFINPAYGIQITNGIDVEHVSNRLGQQVVSAMQDTSNLRLFAAEASGQNAAHGAAFATLSTDGAQVGMAARLINGHLSPFKSADAISNNIPRGGSFGWARENFGAVLSANKSTVFVVGGTEESFNPVTGGETRDATTVLAHIILPSSLRVKLEYEIDGPKPKTVLATTYRPADDSLYVLDQKGHTRRMIRIDLATWKSEVLGRWPATWLFDEQHLSNAPDGTLVLTSSASRLGTHVVVGIRPTDQGLDVDWVRLGHGRAIGAPSFGPKGMTVWVDLHGEVRHFGVDRDDLEHRWFDLAECL